MLLLLEEIQKNQLSALQRGNEKLDRRELEGVLERTSFLMGPITIFFTRLSCCY
jgi:hypothetical protein